MKFLALEREKPGLNAQDFAPHGKAEARRAWELYTQGVFRAMYFNSEAHTAILILEALDKAAAQAALDTLPMVQAGLITFDLIPLSQSSLVFSETIVGNSLKCNMRSLRTFDFWLSGLYPLCPSVRRRSVTQDNTVMRKKAKRSRFN